MRHFSVVLKRSMYSTSFHLTYISYSYWYIYLILRKISYFQSKRRFMNNQVSCTLLVTRDDVDPGSDVTVTYVHSLVIACSIPTVVVYVFLFLALFQSGIQHTHKAGGSGFQSDWGAFKSTCLSPTWNGFTQWRMGRERRVHPVLWCAANDGISPLVMTWPLSRALTVSVTCHPRPRPMGHARPSITSSHFADFALSTSTIRTQSLNSLIYFVAFGFFRANNIDLT